MKHMRNFFIDGFTERAFGMGLMFPMKELVPHSNTSSRKFPMPALEPKREPVDGFRTWNPIYIRTSGYRDIMVAFPVLRYLRLE